MPKSIETLIAPLRKMIAAEGGLVTGDSEPLTPEMVIELTVSALQAKAPAETPRARMNRIIAALDDEAFAWLALACQSSAMLGGARTQIWPDGLGGFSDREQLEALRKAAGDYIEGQG